MTQSRRCLAADATGSSPHHGTSVEKRTAYFAGQRSAATVPGLPGQARRWCLCFPACAAPIPVVAKSPSAKTAASANLIVAFIRPSLFLVAICPARRYHTHGQACSLHPLKCLAVLPVGHSPLWAPFVALRLGARRRPSGVEQIAHFAGETLLGVGLVQEMDVGIEPSWCTMALRV